MKNLKFKIEEEKLGFDGHLKIQIGKISVSSQNSPSVELNREKVMRGESVSILIYEKDTNSFLFVRQYRYAFNRLLTEIPAGKLDKNEAPEDCVKKEVLEEIGYKIENPKIITSCYISPGYTDERMHIYYCETNSHARIAIGGGLKSEKEFIELVKLSEQEIELGIKNGELADSKLIIAYWWWKLNVQ